MKRIAVILLPLVALAGAACSSSSSARQDAAPAAAGNAPTPTPTPRMTEAQEMEFINTSRALAGLPPLTKDGNDENREEWVIFKDEATGKMLQRIPKGPTLRVVDGKLRHTLLNPNMFQLDLVREDEKYYYVDAPVEPTKESIKEAEKELLEGLNPLLDAPEIEYEVVAPPTARKRLSFEEVSDGLPTAGFWRSNMKVADLDGDGRPEIVTPPPRLAGTTFRVFRLDGKRWASVEPQVEVAGEGRPRFGWGGVDVADMDGDGRPDVIGIAHGIGPVIAFNQGGFRFRAETRGLPAEMSGRAIAAGDVDGDGRMDLVAVSEAPESKEVEEQRRRVERLRQAGRQVEETPEVPGVYRKGIDMRAFFGTPDGRYEERSKGLENGCFGYSLGLSTRPADKGTPYFVAGCRYQGGRALLYDWNAGEKSFDYVGRGVVEEFSFHSGSATGTYKGYPAAFAAYVKGNAPGAVQKPIRGQGVSIYYRDGEGWKRKRLVKALADQGTEAAGLGVGDLDGDGLDDVVWADDSVGRVRVFFQRKDGEFEELDPALQPRYVNHSMSVQVADVDRDGRNDVVLMYEFRTTDKTRAGGLRFFRNAG